MITWPSLPADWGDVVVCGGEVDTGRREQDYVSVRPWRAMWKEACHAGFAIGDTRYLVLLWVSHTCERGLVWREEQVQEHRATVRG